MLAKIRQMAVNYAGGTHPWAEMTDVEMLKSAGLYGNDLVTGERGYNLAAILLLGKDDAFSYDFVSEKSAGKSKKSTDELEERIETDRKSTKSAEQQAKVLQYVMGMGGLRQINLLYYPND